MGLASARVNFSGDSNEEWAMGSILSYFAILPSLSRSLTDVHLPCDGE